MPYCLRKNPLKLLYTGFLSSIIFSLLLHCNSTRAGTFLDDTASENPDTIPAEVKIPESARSRLKANERGFVMVGDMAFKLNRLNRLGFNGQKWPKGILPIEFDPNVSDLNQQRFFQACMEWTEVANVQCVTRSNEGNYVRVHSGSGNWSEVGMQGGMQQLELINWEVRMIIAHEIAHALGAGHEQSRQDRDQFITIETSLIQPGMEGNFRKLPLRTYSAYDFESVMHYPRDAFSTTGASTIVPKPGFEKYAAVMGNRRNLSQGDQESMRRQYGSPTGAMPLGDVLTSTEIPMAADAGNPRTRVATRAAPAQPNPPSIVEDERFQRNHGDENSRIVGGVAVAPGGFPDTVGISPELSSGVQCSGTLIQPDVVLTAAHCVCAGVSGNVYFGNNPRQGGRFMAVKKAVHGLQSCTISTKEGLDLGLLLLEAPVTDVKPRPLADDALVDKAQSYRVAGFGAVDVDAQLFPEEKREAQVVAVSNDCRGSVKEQPDGTTYQCQPGQEIVAGRRGMPDTCQGDSGGPLLVGPNGQGSSAAEADYRLAGVTSRASSLTGTLCGDGGVYERLTRSARDWITQTITTMR